MVELPGDEEVEAAIDEGTPVAGGDPVVSTDGVPMEAVGPASTAESPATAETA